MKDFVVFNYGKGLPKRDRSYGQYPVYGSAGVLDMHDKYIVSGPGVIVGRKGSVGEVYYEKRNFYPIDTVFYITENAHHDLNFLYYLLQTIDFKSFNSDSAVPGLNRNVAYDQDVLLPEVTTQKQIADVLSAYDELIENNARRIEILEELAQSIYKEWFVHFRFPGHEKVKMIDSGTEFGMIPEGWEVRSVEDTFEITGGGTPSKKRDDYWSGGEIFWFTPSDLTSQKSIFGLDSNFKINTDGLNNSSAKLFPPGSVMMTSRATIGEVAIATSESSTNQGFITCIPNESFSTYELYHWLKNNKELFESLSGGSTFKEITKGTFKKIDVLISSKDTSVLFVKTVDPIFHEILNIQKQLTKLRQARDLLLPKLVTGEIEI